MFLLLQFVAFIFSKMSERSLERLANTLTWVGFNVLRVRRALIKKNLDIAFRNTLSDGAKTRIGRQAFKNFIYTVLEFMRGNHIDYTANVEFPDRDMMLDVLDQGKGAFVLCLHIGNWEALGAAISRYLCPMSVIVKKVGSASVDKFVENVRRKNGFLSIKRSEGTGHIKHILSAINKGNLVGFVMDQARLSEDAVPLFGVPARTNSGLAVLHLKTKAPVIPAYIIRTGFNRHVARFLKPLELHSEHYNDSEVAGLTKQFNEVVEKIIVQHPEQYFWLHDRWK